MPDLFDQLAELPVPPPPPHQAFDRSLHERINNRLLVGQIIDLCVRGFGFAVWHFATAVAGTVRFTLTGKYGGNSKNSGPRQNGP